MPDSLTLSRTVDLGHLLTALTLFAGFVWWLFKTIREWKKSSTEEARSGALRLLLKILREQDRPVELSELKAIFNSDALARDRKAYCKKRWRFENDQDFEAAIYRLDWESKIDFVGPHAVQFRVDERPPTNREETRSARIALNAADEARMLQVVIDAFNDHEFSEWNLVSLARDTYRVAPAKIEEFVKKHLYSNDAAVARRATAVLAALTQR